MNNGRFVVVGAGVMILSGIIATYLYYVFVAPGNQMAREVAQAKARLLAETDHQALLKACRELSRQVMKGEIKDAAYMGMEALRLPEPIPALRPNHVTIDRDGLVKIEMYTGWWPVGVRAYPEGYPEYPPPFKYGDRKLLEGLWYYEDGYGLHPDAYDKVIDELLSRNTKLRKAPLESDPNSERSAGQTR